MIRNKLLTFGWSLAAAVLVLTALVHIVRGLPIETNILALLPEAKREPLAALAVDRYNDTFAKHIAFLIGADTEAESLQAANRLIALLQSSSLFEQVTGRLDETQALELYRLYQPYRANLISNQDLGMLLNKEYDSFRRRVIASFISPMPGFNASALETDPLLLFAGFLSGIATQTGNLTFRDGMPSVYHDGRHYKLLTARINGDPFTIDVQRQFSAFYKQTGNTLYTEYGGISLASTGMIHNTEAGTTQAKTEISIIGAGSLIGIFILFTVGFRKARSLLYTLIPIVVGIMAAITVCTMVFQSIHIMTLVFGASLIGVAIDYSLHFFAKQIYQKPVLTRRECLSHIRPAITLSLLTSVIGYTAFFLTPFPGLRQMALFSATGLAAAYCCVVFWFPLLPALPSSTRSPPGLQIARSIIDFWNKRKTIHRMLLLLPLALLAIAQITTARIDDDIRSLDNSPQHLRETRLHFEAITGIKPAGQFFLVSGTTPQVVLELEERLTGILHALKNDGDLQGFHAISNRIPSAERQRLNYRTVRDALLHDGPLHATLTDIGFDTKTVADYEKIHAAEQAAILDFESWRASAVADDSQWLNTGANQHASLVYLTGVNNIERIHEATRDLDNIQLIDQVADISHVFTRYRQLTNKVVVAIGAIILLLMIWRYGPRTAPTIVIPPALAGLCAFAIISLAGQPLTLFNSLALLLVLGIGIDATIFLAENKGSLSTTMTAVMYSAITTVLSFGLLSLSSTPALKSIGITVLCGILVALLLAPIAARNGQPPPP